MGTPFEAPLMLNREKAKLLISAVRESLRYNRYRSGNSVCALGELLKGLETVTALTSDDDIPL
jgi:hypothetical protein